MDDLDKFLFGDRFTEKEISTAAANYENQITLLEQLQEARLALGISFSYISEQLDLEVSIIDEFFSGQREFNLSELRMIANVLEVTVDYVVTSSPK